MQNPIESLATMLIDSADAPDLRVQVAELTAQLKAQDLTIASQARQIERLKLDVKFYYEGFTGKQLKVAEDALGG